MGEGGGVKLFMINEIRYVAHSKKGILHGAIFNVNFSHGNALQVFQNR